MKTIQVTVKPRSRISALEETGPGVFLARVKSAPVDGEANKELLVLLAKHFHCPKSAIEIKIGAGSRTKIVLIDSNRP